MSPKIELDDIVSPDFRFDPFYEFQTLSDPVFISFCLLCSRCWCVY